MNKIMLFQFLPHMRERKNTKNNTNEKNKKLTAILTIIGYYYKHQNQINCYKGIPFLESYPPENKDKSKIKHQLKSTKQLQLNFMWESLRTP